MSQTVSDLAGVSSFSLSRIIYFTNLQLENAPSLALGVMGEIVLPKLRVAGLIAREELIEAELEQVGPLMRDDLSRPFEYLVQHFERAWDEAQRGRAVQMLCEEFTAALSFNPPTSEQVPRRWLVDRNPDLGSLVMSRLAAILEDEFYDISLSEDAIELPVYLQPRHLEKVLT